ncbi:MAG: hypothetical protein ACFUZC_04970 [Chthoniobacteraceae bacterium]
MKVHIYGRTADGTNVPVLVDENGSPIMQLTAGVTLNPGDIEIGAVELKNSTTEERVAIKTDGTDIALTVRANGLPLPAGAATAALQESQLTGLPYGADQQVIAYYGSTNNIQTITYKKAGVVVKTRTFNYAGGGTANDDVLTGTIDA